MSTEKITDSVQDAVATAIVLGLSIGIVTASDKRVLNTILHSRAPGKDKISKDEIEKILRANNMII